jgi:hypothetical protein
MRTFTDTQVQARILREMHERYAKRAKIAQVFAHLIDAELRRLRRMHYLT